MKGYVYKWLLLLMVSLLVGAGYGLWVYVQINGEPTEQTGWEDKVFPDVHTVTGGMESADWTPYIGRMNTATIREGLVPLRERAITLHVALNGNTIGQIFWQIRGIDGERLVHQETVTNWNQGDDAVDVTLSIPGIVEEQTEYYLVFRITLKSGEEIHYYNRFLINPATPYEEQLAFVKHFHDAALDLDDSSYLSSYLDSGTYTATTNLGYVTEQSTKDQVMWANLAPVQTGAERLTVVDFNDAYIGSYQLEYMVTATDDAGIERTYDAKEVFRVRLDEDGITLVDYVKTASERFVPDTVTLTAAYINAGIQPSDQINYVTNERTNAVAFELNGNLWYLNRSENRIDQVMTFGKPDTRHHYRFLRMDEDGSVLFLLYGYLAEGAHKGKVGVALYQYDAQNLQLDEVMFIRYDKSYDYLAESVETLAFVSEDGLLYLMIDDCLYSLSYGSHESVIVADGLREYNYVLSKSKDMVAWNVGGTAFNAESIKLVNMRTGDNTLLRGTEGTYVKAIGFVGNDFVYAVTEKENLIENWAGDKGYAASYVVIVDEHMNVLREYGIDGTYFTDISLNGGMLTFECSEKREDGSFEVVGDDHMVNQQETTSAELTVWQSFSEKEGMELLLSFNNSITEGFAVNTVMPPSPAVERDTTHVFDNHDIYYVYGESGYAGSGLNLGQAIDLAYEARGYVIDASGTYQYKRKTTQDWRSLTGMTVEELQSFLRQYQSGYGMDISGASLTRALSFLGSGEYWLYAGVDEDWVFITEFRNDYVVYMDVDTGAETRKTREDMEDIVAESGNHFLIVPR